MRLLISFADTEQEHFGTIYQATNWFYIGQSSAFDEYIYNGKRWHGRAFRKSHGSHLNYIEKGLEIVKGSIKLRYAYPLDEEMTVKIKSLKEDYPKAHKAKETRRSTSS